MASAGGPSTEKTRPYTCIRSSRRDMTCRALRWIMLFTGIAGLALGLSLVVRADLGAGPWTVFHLGLAQRTGLSIGRITQLVGLIVIGSSAVLLKQRPGVGTVINMILIGFIVDACLHLIGTQQSLLFRVSYLALGVVLTGMGTAVYIAADLGAGPRDGLMMGLHFATKRSIRSVRVSMEVLVLLIGAALGGRVGFGTIVAALLTGPTVQLFMGITKSLAPWSASSQVAAGTHSEDG